jgi:2-polyprenyl-3-methyl-5-hydroxy-6-metoxy-1,4-benzoquinol methylase
MSTSPKWTGERLVPSVLSDVATEHLARYSFCLDLVKDKIVLDAACGEGYGTYLLSASAKIITGIDIDASIVKHAQLKYKNSNISFITGSVLQTPFADQTFDVIVSFETLEHLPEHEAMLQEFKRILKPQGLLIISTPDTEEYSHKPNRHNPYHKKELSLPAFEELVAGYFANSFFFGQQTISGSLIHPLRSSSFENLTRYNGNYDEINKVPLLTAPIYLIALASDVSLPQEKSLLFTGESLLQQLQHAYESTWSYKIGRAITFPVRFIKNLFT